MKVTAILKGTPDKQGKKKVYIRIHDGGDAKRYKATKIKVAPKDWNKEKGLLKYSNPDAALYNSIIKKLISETEAGVAEEVYMPRAKQVDFFEYTKRTMNQVQHVRRANTMRGYWRDINKLKDFRKSFYIHEVDTKFLQQYQAWMYEQGLDVNTVWSYIKFLRAIIRRALKEGVIQKNPFDQFDPPQYKQKMKVWLTMEELQKIDEMAQNPKYNPQIRFSANWFLVGCYSGLRYGDMHDFNKEKHIKDGRLIVETSKTGEIISLPLKGKLKELLERVEYKPLHIHNQVFNRNLKNVMKNCEIEKTMTAHISRHTFATMCANAGIPIEITAKMLGHTNPKMTAIYYKITNRRIDSEFEKLSMS